MRRLRWLPSAIPIITLAGCTLDRTIGPALPNQSPSAQLLEHRQFHAQVASDLESFMASHPPLSAERQRALTEMLAFAQRESQVKDLRSSSVYGPRLDTSGEVDAAGIIDPNGTFESILLLVSQDIKSFTKVTIPAVIDVNMSGTVTANGVQYPISHTANTTIPTLGFVTTVQLPEVYCNQAPASATTATQHSAGWNIRGFGLVAATLRTTATDSCPGPQPCTGGGGTELDQSPGGPNAESGYDPYSSGECEGGGGHHGSGTQYQPGDETGGETVDFGTGVGNGGSSACGDAAVVEFVCFEYYDEVKHTWIGWDCGYVTTC